MPDEYGNPTFKDLFSDPEVFKQLYNVYAPANAYSMGSEPQQQDMFQAQPAQKVPVPSTQLSTWEAIRNAAQVAGANSSDAARIYQGAPVMNMGGQAMAQQDQIRLQREEAAQRAQMFNAGQENQFGRNTQQQQAMLERILMQEQGRNARAEDRNLLTAQSLDNAELRAQLAHQDRIRQLEIAAQNANTAAERARIQEELGAERNRIAELQAQIAQQKANQAVRGRPLDPQTRNFLNDFKTGGDFATEALNYFEKETGRGAGGPVAGRLPSFMQPKTTQNFDTLRVKAQAALRKYLAGSAVTPTEMVALQPLLTDLSGTPNQIRSALKGLKSFYDQKRIAMLNSLETTGIDPAVAAEVRRLYGSPNDAPAPTATPTTPGIRVPSPPPGTVESTEEKIKRAKAAAGIR